MASAQDIMASAQSQSDLERFAAFHDHDFGTIKEADECASTVGLLQFANGFAFDLTNTFTCDLENLADFLKRVRVSVG